MRGKHLHKQGGLQEVIKKIIQDILKALDDIINHLTIQRKRQRCLLCLALFMNEFILSQKCRVCWARHESFIMHYLAYRCHYSLTFEKYIFLRESEKAPTSTRETSGNNYTVLVYKRSQMCFKFFVHKHIIILNVLISCQIFAL